MSMFPSRSSGRGPRELLDAPENLPEEAPRQVALGPLAHEVPSMPDDFRLDPFCEMDVRFRLETATTERTAESETSHSRWGG